MLVKDLVEITTAQVWPSCDCCGGAALIEMHGYGKAGGSSRLCTDCAMQLARKLVEDLCALLTKGGRHDYNEAGESSKLCSDCSLQLTRKHLQDLCGLLTKGGRHG